MKRATALLLAASLVLAGCSSAPDRPTRSQLEAVAAELEADTEALDGVEDVRVSIGDGALPESMGVVPSFDVTVIAPTLDRQARGELGLALARRIWSSDLSDIATVSVMFDDGPSTVVQQLDDVTDEVTDSVLTASDMEALFGPRDT